MESRGRHNFDTGGVQMNFTIFTAHCSGQQKNCLYPDRREITSSDELGKAVRLDHVCVELKDNYRSDSNFLSSNVVVMDCDNDHSDNPSDWITPDKLDELMPDIAFAWVPSRNNMLPKESRSARPRGHVYFPIAVMTDKNKYTKLKTTIQAICPFFDKNALDASRFIFGAESGQPIWHDGWVTIDEEMGEDLEKNFEKPSSKDAILEGSRNNTMSHFAGRVLKKYGICDKAHDLFLERAEKCTPPLDDAELDGIWRSAIKFFKKVAAEDGYVPPEEYNADFEGGSLKPADYSDIGEAKVIAANCADHLRFTSATDYIVYCGDRWHEDKQKALGAFEAFMDMQLEDAEEAIRTAEEALIILDIPKDDVRGRSKNLVRAIPADKLGLLYALIGADTYKKFVMKYRNYNKIVDAQNAAKPMLAIDVSELDYDAELLNTPNGTFDLSRGLEGVHSHDPDDLITKVTNCSPGDTGTEIWQETLDTFFCGDTELIDYVQQIVGMAAVGRVYAEQMIIAYGDGANGKSTFWNTIARVLGNYSGKISAEALTMNCKRNVKPEMAELKGKRLIIASELEEGTRLNTSMVKQLCSVDPIEAEKKYKDPFHFEPSHTLVLYTNHLPRVSANDDGTWRRLIVIPFNAKINEKSDVKNFGDYLFEKAGPAIMKWIIKGAELAIRKQYRIPEPKAVVEAVAKYREDNDWLGKFIEERCEVGDDFEEKSGELYQVYRNACIQTGEYIRGTTDFYGSLEKVGFERMRRSTGRVVVGLRLKDGQDFLET